MSGGGHGSDREVTIVVKRGVEAKNYGDVRRFLVHIVVYVCLHISVSSCCVLSEASAEL